MDSRNTSKDSALQRKQIKNTSQPLKIGIALKVSKSNLKKNGKKIVLGSAKYLMQQLCLLPLYWELT